MTDLEKKWLIKSDSKILGPFSFEQLEDLLRRRQVALIDEVRDMERRWSYIREIPELKNMVENVRIDLEKKSEATRTLQTSLASTESSVTQTKTEEIVRGDFTNARPTFTDIQFESKEISEVNDVKDFSPPLGQTFSKSKTSGKVTNKYGSLSDPTIQRQISSNRRKHFALLFIIVFLLISSAVGFYFYKKSNQDNYERNLYTQFRKYYQYGLDAKAADVYQKMTPKFQLKAVTEGVEIVPYLQKEGLIRTERSLEILLEKVETVEKKSTIELLLFNKSMNEKNFKEAEVHLLRAKDFYPSSDSVKENEAILDYYRENYSSASARFLDLYNKNNSGRLLYGYAMAALLSKTYSANELSEVIDRYMAMRMDYKKQLSLIQIALAAESNNIKAIGIYLNDFVSVPVKLTDQFYTPRTIFKNFYEWNDLEKFYHENKKNLSDSQQKVIKLHLSLEKNQSAEAAQILKSIDGKIPEKDFVDLNIAVLSEQNRFAELFALEKAHSNIELNTASHMALLRQKVANSPLDIEAHYEHLKKEKNILSSWAELIKIPKANIQAQKNLVQQEILGGENFIPFLEIRGEFE